VSLRNLKRVLWNLARVKISVMVRVMVRVGLQLRLWEMTNKIGQFYLPILSANKLANKTGRFYRSKFHRPMIFSVKLEPSSTSEFIPHKNWPYRSCVIQKSANFLSFHKIEWQNWQILSFAYHRLQGSCHV